MLSDEHIAFLRAIFKWPADWTTRLVYADWLDEHAHPGGELLRLRHELAVPTLSKTARAKLAARERKVLKTCDREWIVQLERADWKLRYLDVRPADEDPASWAKRRKYLWSIPGQRAMTQALADFEAEVGLPLPCSWKSFALACGAGKLEGDWIWVPAKGGDMGPLHHEWSGWKKVTEAQIDEFYPLHALPGVRPWIRHSLRFSNGDGTSDILVWNTTQVTDPARSEYEIVLLDRELCRSETFDSFQALWDFRVEQCRRVWGDEACPFSPE